MSSNELRLINPYTEQSFMSLSVLDLAEAEAVVARARRAFDGWRRSSLGERRALCTRFLAAFEAMKDAVA